VPLAVSTALLAGLVAGVAMAAQAVPASQPGRGSAHAASQAARAGVAGPMRPGKDTKARIKAQKPVPGLARALAQAKRSGRRVEVTSLRTETTQVFANPQGTMTMVRSAMPVRVRRGGSWAAIDTKLRARADGRVAPVAATGGLRLSGGGDGPLASLAAGSRRVALWWPRRLASPVLTGDTATYRDVLPGVDLKMRATADGFGETLVIKDRAAAADPGLSRIRLAVTATGMRMAPGKKGGLELVDPRGRRVFTAGTPVMWDRAGRTKPMQLAVSRGAVTVVPDRRMLADPATHYPVYVDPDVSLGLTAWGNITAAAPSQTMAQDPFRSEGAKAGKGCDSNGCYVYRSMFQFSMAGLGGKHILGATFAITMYHSWSCSDTPVELWSTGYIDVNSTAWNNSSWYQSLDTRSAHANCGSPAVRMEFSGGLAGQVQYYAAGWWPAVAVGLKAPDETDVNQWKRFNADATLSVTYNSYPSTPTALTVDGKACTTGAGRPYLADQHPTLAAQTGDPDGGQLLGVRFSGAQLGSALAPWVQQDNLPNDGTHPVSAQKQLPDGVVADGKVYSFQAYATDYTDNSGWSGACEFGIDLTAPNPPKQISSADYPADGAVHGMEGVTGTFTFTPPDIHPEDVTTYLVGLNCNQPTCARAVPANPSAGYNASAAFTPDRAGPNTLNVWTRDKAGNLSSASQPTPYTFLVRSPGSPAAQYRMSEGSGTTTADGSGNGNTAAFSGGVGWDGGRRGAGTALSFGGSAYAATAGPLTTTDPNDPTKRITARTDQSFTVSAWLNPASTDTGTFWPTAVSADGAHASAFFLRHTFAPNPRWVFTMVQSDADNAPNVNVTGTSDVKPGAWTHVAGSYDAATGTMRLYVNGTLEGQATIPAAFNAGGPLVIGRAKWNSQLNHYWQGKVDDVRFDARLLSGNEIAAMADSPVLTGHWELDEGTGTTAHDTSGVSQPFDGALSAGASWVVVDPADARPDGGMPDGANAIHFNGSTGLVAAPGGLPSAFPVPVADPVSIVYNSQLHVFARDTSSGRLFHAWCVKCDGTDWHSEDMAVNISGAPSMAIWNNELRVVVTSHQAGSLTPQISENTYYPGSGWDGWMLLPFSSAASPAATVYNGTLHVTARDTSTGHVVDAYCSACDTSPVMTTQDLGGVITGTPSVAVFNNQFRIVADGSDGTSVWQKWWDPTTGWHDWQGITGSATSPVTTVANGAFILDARSTSDGHLVHGFCYKCDGSDWTIVNLGGIITGTPSVAVFNNQFRIVADGSDGTSVWQKWWDPSTGWHEWQPVFGPAASPVATAYNGQLHITGQTTGTGDLAHFWCATCNGFDWRAEDRSSADTGNSFTVTAWVRLASTASTQTAVSLNGGPAPAAHLDYSAASKTWTFSMTRSDSASSQTDTAIDTTGVPVVGQWAHLAGVYDAVTHTLNLYVDGTLAGTASHVSTWDATGQVYIGGARVSGALSAPWNGDIAGVRVYSGVLSNQQIADLAGA
jgi:Concanavalin A-like lectin/glucanases superfamily